MNFDATVTQNNRGEIRVLLAALFGATLLVAGAVAIALNDVKTSQNHPLDATLAHLRADTSAPADAN